MPAKVDVGAGGLPNIVEVNRIHAREQTKKRGVTQAFF
jgi:hypothetical protein